MTWVDPADMERKQDCACGCGIFGAVRKKTGHVNRCECRRCKAPRYKQRATRDEHKVAKDLHGERQVLSGALNGADVLYPGGCVEVTREKRIAGPVRTAWEKKTSRIMERRHRFAEVPVLILTDEKPWLCVLLYDDWTSP